MTRLARIASLTASAALAALLVGPTAALAARAPTSTDEVRLQVQAAHVSGTPSTLTVESGLVASTDQARHVAALRTNEPVDSPAVVAVHVISSTDLARAAARCRAAATELGRTAVALACAR